MASAIGTQQQSGMTDDEKAQMAFKIITYIVGVTGNLLVIFVILFLQEYKKITHWYVLQMAFADFVFLQNIPFSLDETSNGKWIHAEWLCGAQQTVLYLTYYASIMFLVIMAMDRYLAVCHSMTSFVQRVRQPHIAYITALVTWIVALLMTIPVMLNTGLRGIQPSCTCRLQFPVNVEAYCTLNGLASNQAQMKECREEIFPAVVGQVRDCADTAGVFNANKKKTPQNRTGLFDSFPLPVIPPMKTSPDVTINPIPPSFSGTVNLSSSGSTVLGVIPQRPPVFSGTVNLGSSGSTVLGTIPQQPNSSETINLAPSGNTTGTVNLGPIGNTGSVNSFPGLPDSFFNEFPISLGSGDFFIPDPFSTNRSNGNGNGNQQTMDIRCHYDVTRTGYKTFTILNSVVMFFIPLLIIAFCYGLIIRRLIASSISSGSGKGKATSGKSDREKRKVTILCALLTILFTIFWLPFHSFRLAKLVGIPSSDGGFCVRLQTASAMLVYIGSATNPYLYNFLGTFKHRMKQIKNSKRMQNILSAAGLTGMTDASNAVSSSDKTTSKANNSAIPMNSMAT